MIKFNLVSYIIEITCVWSGGCLCVCVCVCVCLIVVAISVFFYLLYILHMFCMQLYKK